MSYTKGYRYNIIPEGGGPYLVVNKEIQNPTYAATMEVVTTQEETKVELALTGAATINATDISGAYATDKLSFNFSEDSNSGGRVVTFGTNFITNSTVTVAEDKYATISFMFSSSANKWVETGRFVQS